MLVKIDGGMSIEDAVQEWKDGTDEWQAWLP
jgi:hypothetical protein